MSADPNEAQVIAAARGGEAFAIGRLIDAHQAPLRAFLRRYAGPWADADDLAQETLVRALDRLHQFQGRSSFRSWLFGIGYRLAGEAARAGRRRMARDGVWAAHQDDATNPVEAMAPAVRAALADLPEGQRACIVLCLVLDFSHAEASEALGLPVGTVKSHIARGRAALAQKLGMKEEAHHD